MKTWMCGGRIEIVPCSHIGHVGRKKFPYNENGEIYKAANRNRMRVAAVWMDEYADAFFDTLGK